MARLGAAIAGLLLGVGTTLLLAAFAPHLPGGSRIASVAVADARHAPLVASGIVLLLLGGVLLALLRGAPAGVAAAAAAVGPLAIATVAVLRAGSALWSAAATDELDRLLLAGGAIAVLVAPTAAWLALDRGAVRREREGPAWWEMTAVAGIAVAFGAIVILGLAQDAPFSWDESVYALTTRHWLQGTPNTGWGLHRPPVLSLLGVLPMLGGGDEALFRLIGLAFGMGAVLATWFVARSMAGPWAGLVAAAAVAAAPSVQIDAGLLLNDVPAAAVLLLLIGLAWRQFAAPGPIGWGILWLAPVAAAAFYLRYGSILAIGAIGLAIMLLWPRRLVESWLPIGASVALLAALLAPHAIFATLQTGSPWGIATLAQSGARGAYIGAGLVQYLAWLPSVLMGLVSGLVAVIGLVGSACALALALVRRAWEPRARALALLVLPALMLIGVLGLLQLPQSRYLFLPMMLLMVAGAVVLADLARLPGRVPRLAGVTVAGALLVGLVGSAITMPERADARAATYEWLRQAGHWIRDDGAGSCSILASDVPQLTWYSGCETYNFANRERSGREALLTGDRRYLVVRRDGRFQPEAGVLADYLALVEPGAAATFENRNGIVVGTVFRFAAR